MAYRKAISSHSLGRAWVHSLPSKLNEAARFGFDIELFYEDLYYVAKAPPGGPTSGNLLEAARIIRSLCDDRGIAIVCLQPFMHYEGLKDRSRHRERLSEMKLWIRMAGLLNTDVISIPSTCLPEEEVSGDVELIVQDMREVADLAAVAGVTLAYEALGWGTHVDTWEQAWAIVVQVKRPNFKICLDTFNIAVRVFADPTAPSRKNADAHDAMRKSLESLGKIPAEMIAYVQVVDAQYLPEPLVGGHEFYDASQAPRMSWSRNCRLFYGEENLGAYLPVKEILKTILVDIGFKGWISAELFNASLTDPSAFTPERHAQRAEASWQKMVKDFQLESQSSREDSPMADDSTSLPARL